MESNSRSLTPALELATYLLDLPLNPDIDHNIAAVEHRQNLIKLWGIHAGNRVLEIGPGQGDLTVTLADAVGPNGLIVGVDPAPLGYGTPSLGSAQAHVLASAVGSRIKFIQVDPIHYIASEDCRYQAFDCVVFCHCIWYFSDSEVLPRLLARAHNAGIPTVFIAEYSLSTSSLNAIPHVLTAMALNALESHRGESSKRNIRCALSPAQIRSAAEKNGWILAEESIVTPGEKQRDGWRETLMLVQGSSFARDVEELGLSSKAKASLLGMKDAVESSVAQLEGGLSLVRNMDVWLGKFERKNS